jgi:mono/diheme cytochrome c family protein
VAEYHLRAEFEMRRLHSGATLALIVLCVAAPASADDGKGLLERNCGRCHALSKSAASPLTGAPNLWTTLRSYPSERLEFELSEGIGSRHKDMPQIQFSSDEIALIQNYLFSADGPDR